MSLRFDETQYNYIFKVIKSLWKKKKESMGALDFPLQDLELSVKLEG